MPNHLPTSDSLAASFCCECGRGLISHWKFCVGCGQGVGASVLPPLSGLDALLRATAAAKATRPGVSLVGERTVLLTRAPGGAGLSASDLNVTLMGTPPLALKMELAYRRGLEAARAFEQSRRLPPPRQSDYPPALIVSAFALIMALAVFALFYFVQHF